MSIVDPQIPPDELRAAALAYARRGWRVLPVHAIDERGVCTCGKPDCGSPGKHPMTPRGCLNATTDAETVSQWWTQTPGGNVGIATGMASGIFAVDLDGQAGIDAFKKLVERNGEPPQTFTIETGGGSHLYFRWPTDRTVGNRTKIGGQPIDVRGEGGYVVAAPSRHKSGRLYRVCVDRVPAVAPQWILELVAPINVLPVVNGRTLSAIAIGADLPSRIRAYLAKVPPAVTGQSGHAHTYATANTLVHGFDLAPNAALPYLIEWNATCQPPWTEKELRHKLDDAAAKGGPPPGKQRGYLLSPNESNCPTPEPAKVVVVDPWRPFPVEALPEPLRSVAVEGSRALGCDPAFVALPLLAVVAGAIGNARRIRAKRTWTEPPIIWAAIVGESGSLKSPALDLAVRPLRDIQSRLFDEYRDAMAAYEIEQAEYDRDLATWRKRKDGGEPPRKPDPPTCRRLYAADTTIEKLAALLGENPNGLLIVRDELAGWFGSFSRYKAQAGSDCANWLELHRAGTLVNDRKQSGTIHIPHACVSIVGGVQPGVLARALTTEHREAGLAARILFAMPPRTPKRWTEADLSEVTERRYHELIGGLIELDIGSDGEPYTLELAPKAKRRWVEHYDKWNREHGEAEGDLAAAYSKLEGYAIRFALIHHVVVNVGRASQLERVGVESVEAGIALANWFALEARRVYTLLGESDADRNLRRLVELIERKGGSITARELMRSATKGRYPDIEAAQAVLNRLAQTGLGTLSSEAPDKGGHAVSRFTLDPTRHPTLDSQSNSAQPPGPKEGGPTVDSASWEFPEGTEPSVGSVGRRAGNSAVCNTMHATAPQAAECRAHGSDCDRTDGFSIDDLRPIASRCKMGNLAETGAGSERRDGNA